MNFVSTTAPLSRTGLKASASRLGIQLPALWAVLTVETRGCGFLPDRRPVILFERHIFHRLSQGRFAASAPDLSDAKAGGYGAGGAAQYARLERALALDEGAALKATSWGLGQVMGFNAESAGFSDVREMVKQCVAGEDAQLAAMAGFVQANGLAKHLKSANWAAFAQAYNGVDFQKNQYDSKLAQAHARFQVGPLPDMTVRWVQLALLLQGYSQVGGVDGWYGSNTQKALLKFQADQGLSGSGKPDAATLGRLAGLLGWSLP